MKKNAPLFLLVFCAAGTAAFAQQGAAGRDEWFAKMGVVRSGGDYVYAGPTGRTVLTADQLRRLNEFEATLEAAPDADAVLGGVARRHLGDEGLGLDSPEGAAWFEKGRLTQTGRLAVPGILFKSSASSGAGANASPSLPAKSVNRSVTRIDAVIAASGNPSFDGSVSAAGSPLPEAPGESSSMPSLKPSLGARPLDVKNLPDAPKPAKPDHTAVEKDLFWGSWWGYHAAFAADFTTTGMVISRGGHEMDPLYTRFGNKNMGGVIGSAIALHAVASVASVELYKQAAKKHGLMRYALDAAAIGINSYGIGTHSWGAGHNVGVLNDWNTPAKPR